jgi:hypothetical protein
MGKLFSQNQNVRLFPMTIVRDYLKNKSYALIMESQKNSLSLIIMKQKEDPVQQVYYSWNF